MSLGECCKSYYITYLILSSFIFRCKTSELRLLAHLLSFCIYFSRFSFLCYVFNFPLVSCFCLLPILHFYSMFSGPSSSMFPLWFDIVRFFFNPLAIRWRWPNQIIFPLHYLPLVFPRFVFNVHINLFFAAFILLFILSNKSYYSGT